MKIEQYSKFELITDKEIKVVSPCGDEKILTPFLHQPVEFIYDSEGVESVKLNGPTVKMVRFYPNEPGIYKFDGGEFECVIGDNHGYVEVSKNDPRYFCYTDGENYNPIGINLAILRPFDKSDGKEFGISGYKYLGMRKYESWFKQCKENGVNFIRIWLGQEYLSPDTEQAGTFNLVQFSKIDKLLELAEKYDIKLKLTLEQFRFLDYTTVVNSDSKKYFTFNAFNKKLYLGNKRCENITEWLDEDIWRQKWLDKVRQLAYRYSGNTSVFGIELWNEMNCLPWKSVLDWNAYMLPNVKKLFPNQLVFNSLGSFDCADVLNYYNEFVWEFSDIKQMHRYLDQGAGYTICHGSPIDFICDGVEKLAEPQKPFFLAETGAVNNCHSGPFRYYSADHRGIIFCDTVYTPIFCGAAGCGHIWHWDADYVESKNLYKSFKPIQILTENIAFDKEHFTTERYEDDEIVLLLLKGDNVTLGYLRNKNDTWQNILRDLKPEKPIENKKIRFVESKKNMKIINIMEDTSNKIFYNDNSLEIKYMKYGAFLKFED